MSERRDSGAAEARERLRRQAQNEQTAVALNHLLRATEAERDALAQRCRELEEVVERMDGCNRAIAADALAACSERDTMRAEVAGLKSDRDMFERIARHVVRVYIVDDDAYNPGAALEKAMERLKEQHR